MGDQAGLDAGHDDGVPLAALRGVEREQLDAVAVGRVAERVVGRDPRTEREPVAERLLAEEVEHRGGNPAVGLLTLGVGRGLDVDGSRSGGASSTSCAHARSCDADVGAALRPARSRRARCPARSAAVRIGTDASASARRSPWSCWCVRASTAIPPAWIATERHPRAGASATRAASSASSAATTISTGGPSARADTTSDACPDERRTCDACGDDLRGAPPVRRQAHDLDAGQVPVDLGEQCRVGAVERVDGLRRVADEEEITAVGRQLVEDPVLDRVEVLGLVDEDVPEPPPRRVGERSVGGQVATEHEEQVVEVDHAASALEDSRSARARRRCGPAARRPVGSPAGRR